jgi:hypothetical protein
VLLEAHTRGLLRDYQIALERCAADGSKYEVMRHCTSVLLCSHIYQVDIYVMNGTDHVACAASTENTQPNTHPHSVCMHAWAEHSLASMCRSHHV